MSKAHHGPQFKAFARAVRAYAWANPGTRCWRCKRTQAEHQRVWHAGHTIDGDPLAQPWLSALEPPAGSWLRPECAECNLRGGAHRTNTMTNRPGTSRTW